MPVSIFTIFLRVVCVCGGEANRKSLNSSWVHSGSTATVLFLFVCRLLLNVPVNKFSVTLGWNQRFLGVNQYCGKLKVPSSRTLHGRGRH